MWKFLVNSDALFSNVLFLHDQFQYDLIFGKKKLYYKKE